MQLPINMIILRKHLIMVYSESTECHNTINYSPNHYTVKFCDLGKQQLGQLCCYRNFSVLETYAPFTNHGPDLWLKWLCFVFWYNAVQFTLPRCLPGTTFPSLCNWRNDAIMGQVFNPLASEVQGNLLTFCSKFVTHWYTMVHRCLCSQRLVYINLHCVAFVSQNFVLLMIT